MASNAGHSSHSHERKYTINRLMCFILSKSLVPSESILISVPASFLSPIHHALTDTPGAFKYTAGDNTAGSKSLLCQTIYLFRILVAVPG